MSAQKVKILIVDDDAEILEMYRELFEIEGFDVKVSASPIDGLDVYKQNNNIQLIISDSHMKEMSGIDFLKSLKASYETIPVFYLVTGDIDQSEEVVKSAGGHGLILKPFDLDEILIKIKKDLNM